MGNDESEVAPEIAGVVAGGSADARALAALAERYRLLVELSPDAIVVHENGRVVYINPAGVKYARVASAAAIVGKPITDFVHPDSIPEMLSRIMALTTEGSASEPAEAVMLRGDGESIVSEVVSVRTVWDGRPAFQVIMRDITAQKAMENALRFQAALVDHVSDAIIAMTADGVVVAWNAAAERIYGRAAASAIGSVVEECVGSALDASAVVALGGVVDAVHHRSSGATVDVRVSVTQMDDGYVVVCADQTAGRRATERLTAAVSTLHEGVVVVGADEAIEVANPAAIRLLGLPEDAVPGLSVQDVVLRSADGGALMGLDNPIVSTLRTGRACIGTIVRIGRVSEELWLSVSCRPLDPGQDSSAIAVSLADVTSQRVLAERHRHEAMHDPLTGLANRVRIMAHLDDAIDVRGGTQVVVNYIDLDNFKTINDSLGHGVGDEVLRVVGQRLRSAVRADDLVGRLGGDEFVVISRSTIGELSVHAQADRLREVLTRPFTVDGHTVRVDASIGVTVADSGDGRSSLDVLHDADTALYRAKSDGRGRHVLFQI